jgi:aspartyl-tRNA(Asn)/glutamyl-tRNA(Gln) amidotransferase subunit A
MSSPLLEISALEQAAAVRSKTFSATELTQATLTAIAKYDKVFHAFLKVDDEGALRRAKEIDADVAQKRPLGPLAGVPVAVKDMIVTRGLETTAASKILGGWIPPYDAHVIDRLRAAGAVIVGKTNLDEFAMGSSNEHSAFGACRNPWNKDRVSGGSSGGSAAAVAARFSALALGTDTGGSVRQPASFCGVVGIKPTYGRVSRYGVIAFASSLDQVGVLSRTVADAALGLRVISGFDERDSTSLEQPVPDFSAKLDKQIAGLKIGVPTEYFEHDIDADVQKAIEASLRKLEDAGARRVSIKLPHTRYAIPAYYLIAPAEASSNLARYDGVRYGYRAPGNLSLTDMYAASRGQGFGAEVKRRIMLGTFALRSGYYDAYYAQAQKARALIRRDFEEAFKTVDVIASPTSPVPAFAFGARKQPLDMYLADIFTLSANLAGLPGISVPAGLSSERLPIGIQFIGRPLDEATLFQVATACERSAGMSAMRPTELGHG